MSQLTTPKRVVAKASIANKPSTRTTNHGFDTRQDTENERGGPIAAFGLLYDLLLAVRQGAGGWQVAESGTEETAVANVQTLLEQAYSESTPMTFNIRGRRLYLGWDDDAKAPYLEVPSGDSDTTHSFNAELTESGTGDMVWSAKSAHNRLLMPAPIIDIAIREYERRKGHTQSEDNMYTLTILEETI